MPTVNRMAEHTLPFFSAQDTNATDSGSGGGSTSSTQPDVTVNVNADVSNQSFVTHGFVDLYARLCEPGFKRRGTIERETALAKQSGFAHIVCAPDTNPSIDSTATVQQIQATAAAVAPVHVHPMGALTIGLEGSKLTELVTLRSAGCLIFGQADQPISDSSVLLRAMEYAATFDIPISLRPFDAAFGGTGCVHDGPISSRHGLPGIPALAETAGLARLLELAHASGCRLHVSRLSCARSVKLIQNAKKSGLNVTADVGIHHLFFTDEQIDGYDSRFHSAVPFRSEADRDALRQGISDGVIDAICSDHAPLDSDSRLAPLPATAPGLSCYPQFLALWLALPKLLGVSTYDLLHTITSSPARALGLTLDSELTPKFVIDPEAAISIDDAAHHNPLTGINNLQYITGEDIELRGTATCSELVSRT